MDSNNKEITISELEIIRTTDDKGNKYINGYKTLKLLGKGSYSTVKMVEKNEELFAMKTVNKTLLQKKNKGFFKNESGQVIIDSLLENAMREIAILKKCRHDNVIKLYEIIQDDVKNKIYLILELCENGALMETRDDNFEDDEEESNRSLFKLNPHFKKNNYSEDEIRDFLRDIVMGLDYLHHNGIIHRDIKPDNIILDNFNNCKITDFNVSSMLKNSDDDKIGKKIEGTDSFRAPECCGEKALDLSGKPLDIWALGVTAFILAYKDLPFKAEDEMDILGLFDKILEAEVVFPSTRDISPGFKDFINKCLVKDPKKRITTTKIKLLPWINEKRTPLNEMKKPELIVISHSEVTNCLNFFATIQLVKKCADIWKKKVGSNKSISEVVEQTYK